MPSDKVRSVFFPLLWFLSKVYAFSLFLRHVAYDLGLKKTTKLPVPIISVGNIAAGGSGKSPFTVWLANALYARGLKIAILSRGYGRTSKGTVIVSHGKGSLVSSTEGGDEPVMMAKLTEGVPIVVDSDRISGGKFILENFSPDCIILDDAMQHRKIFRDIDITLWNSHQKSKELSYLPLGHQRDLYSRLRNIDYLLLTKVSGLEEIEKWRFLEKWHIINSLLEYRILTPINAKSNEPIIFKPGMRGLAFAGIAFPEHFFMQVKSLAGDIDWEFLSFGDHHEFDADFIDMIKDNYPDVDIILTTEKDYAKLDHLMIQNLYIVPQTINQLSGPPLIESILERIGTLP